MARLQNDQAKELLLNPKNKASIELAVYQEQRLMMHCEPILEKYNLPNRAFRNFTLWWQSLVSRDKYDRIAELLGTPLSTVAITKDIFDQLGKFIDAQDRYIEYKFVKEDYTNDYQEYLDKINDDSFWKQRMVSALRCEINSYIVTDLPREQTTERPEPYNYLVCAAQLIDVDINNINGNVEYIIFKQRDTMFSREALMGGAFASILTASEPNGNAKDKHTVNNAIVIDDYQYRVFSRLEGKNGKDSDWILTHESNHDLGYCPVIDFWTDAIKRTNGISKRGPLTAALRKLDYLLFFRACKDYMDLYGPFPILVTYEDEDEEFDQKDRQDNYGGNGIQPELFNAYDNATYTANPKKSAGRNLVAPGSRTTVPAPVSSQDYNLMDNPMKYVGMDVESMKLVDEKVKALECEIIELCTGEDEDYMNEIAKNPEMLSASYERKDTILTWIKRNYERSHRFVTKCRAELRYGKGYFQAATIDYGSDYFLKDAQTLVEEFKKSVEAGMSQGYTDQISLSANKTRYKNNPELLARMRILNDLEPYRNLSWEEMVNLGLNVSDKQNFILKVNFLSFINKFELENGSIVKFGSAIPYSKKIDIIQQTLNDYVRSIKWTESAPAVSGKPSAKSGK